MVVIVIILNLNIIEKINILHLIIHNLKIDNISREKNITKKCVLFFIVII